MSFYPQLRALQYGFIQSQALSQISMFGAFTRKQIYVDCKPPVNHSATPKPLDGENNCSDRTVINLLSKDLQECRKPA